MDLIQLIHVPSVLLSCHIESSVLVSADEQSWLQVDLSEPKPCCWTQISIPVALVILCWSPDGNARSAWRISDWPSQLGRIFCLVYKSLLCSSYSEHLHEAQIFSHDLPILRGLSRYSSPDLAVISVRVVLFPSLQSPREMVSHCSWISIDLYLWKSFLPVKMNVSSSLPKYVPLGMVSFHWCPFLNGLQCSNQPLIDCISIYTKPSVEQAHIFHLSANWLLFSQSWWFRKY